MPACCFGAAFDALDGIVARARGLSSDAGEVLDAVVDRYADAAPLLGLAVYYRASLPALLLVLCALLGSMLVSYVRAKSEAMSLSLPGGLMRRHERIAYLTAGLLLGPLWQMASIPLQIAADLAGRSGRGRGLESGRGATHARGARCAGWLGQGSEGARLSPTPQPKRRLRVLGELPGPKSRALRSAEAEYLAPGTQAIWEYAGIAIDSGSGSELLDVDGNRFLDFVAGISVAALGYAHPRYLAEFGAQLAKIHVGSFTTEARLKALSLLSEMLPKQLSKVQLFSGGSEAVESALRLARAYTGKFEVLSFWGGFHGKTSGALAQMGCDFKHGLGADAAGCTPHAVRGIAHAARSSFSTPRAAFCAWSSRVTS